MFVAFGAGASLAALVTAVPALVVLSQHKLVLFAVAGTGLAVGGWLQWMQRSWPCPADPKLAQVCARTRKQSQALYLVALAAYLVGGFFAFALPVLKRAF